ncbi:hypothetical protein [uncultured Sphingomonas sp.]|uniref:hypothetical protein n=1 Tax=uncultured Sphingomonas sp. TaxID=158754 RepID=UPI0025E4DECD|nr:hypothetical protein [uncultured Sphingomonas sp.]
MDTPTPSPKPSQPREPTHLGTVTRLVRISAPAPDFLPPLEGESAMLLHLLGREFMDLIEGA